MSQRRHGASIGEPAEIPVHVDHLSFFLLLFFYVFSVWKNCCSELQKGKGSTHLGDARDSRSLPIRRGLFEPWVSALVASRSYRCLRMDRYHCASDWSRSSTVDFSVRCHVIGELKLCPR